MRKEETFFLGKHKENEGIKIEKQRKKHGKKVKKNTKNEKNENMEKRKKKGGPMGYLPPETAQKKWFFTQEL